MTGKGRGARLLLFPGPLLFISGDELQPEQNFTITITRGMSMGWVQWLAITMIVLAVLSSAAGVVATILLVRAEQQAEERGEDFCENK